MELKIIEEKENPLFNRKEIAASITNNVVPSTMDVEKLLSEKYSTPAENIQVKKILGKFGSKSFEITANIYNTKKDKNQTEVKTKKQREAEKKAAQGEGAK